MAGATRSIVIDAPIEKVFDVIAAYEKYSEFLGEITSSRVKETSGNVKEVTFAAKIVMEIGYTLRLVETRPTAVDWTLVSGTMMKLNNGSWRLEALGPNQTKATYTIEVALKGLVPKSVSTGLIETTLPKTLEAFKRRAES